MSYKHAWLLVDAMNGASERAGGGARRVGRWRCLRWTTIGLEGLGVLPSNASTGRCAIVQMVEKFKRRIQVKSSPTRSSHAR